MWRRGTDRSHQCHSHSNTRNTCSLQDITVNVWPGTPQLSCTFQVSACKGRLMSPCQDDGSSFKCQCAAVEAILTGFMKRCNTRLKIDDMASGSRGLVWGCVRTRSTSEPRQSHERCHLPYKYIRQHGPLSFVLEGQKFGHPRAMCD